jgi:hypothetical protein
LEVVQLSTNWYTKIVLNWTTPQPQKIFMGGSNGSVVATPHRYHGSPVFMTYKAKIGAANGAGVVQLCSNWYTKIVLNWTTPKTSRKFSWLLVGKFPNLAHNYVMI